MAYWLTAEELIIELGDQLRHGTLHGPIADVLVRRAGNGYCPTDAMVSSIHMTMTQREYRLLYQEPRVRRTMNFWGDR